MNLYGVFQILLNKHQTPEQRRSAWLRFALAILIQGAFGLSENGISATEGLSVRAPASINRAAIALSQPSRIFYGTDGEAISPELILLYNQMQSEEKPVNVSDYIPINMQPTSDSGQVFSQIADRGVGTYLSRPEVRESFVGQRATQMEEKMKAEVVIPSAERQHKFNFNLQAFQAIAKIEYTGFTKAALQYRMAQSMVGIEVAEQIVGNKELVLSHSVQSDNRISEVNLRWGF